MGFWNKAAGVLGAGAGFVLGGPAGAAAGYGIANGLTSGGSDAPSTAPSDASRYTDLLEQNRTGAGAQDAITKYTQAAMAAAMPSFQSQLQLTREDGVRRGISTGDLGTSNEGDLASAFQRNITNSVASHATDTYEQGQTRYADLLSGRMDRTTADENYGRQRKAGLLGAAGSALGAWYGGRNGGGTTGAATGASIGGTFGRAIGGY